MTDVEITETTYSVVRIFSDRGVQLPRPKYVLRTTSYQAAKKACKAGMCVCIGDRMIMSKAVRGY